MNTFNERSPMFINYLVHELLLNKLSSWTLMNWFDESVICCSRMFKNMNSLMNIHERSYFFIRTFMNYSWMFMKSSWSSRRDLHVDEINQHFNRQIIQLEFSPTWSCVSLTRSTTSSEWTLPCLKGGTKCGNNQVKKRIYAAPAVKGF